MTSSSTFNCPIVEDAIVHAFSEGLQPSLNMLRDGQHHHYTVRAECDLLATEGRLLWQRSKSALGSWPYIVNLSPLEITEGTLADVLGPYLADKSVSTAQKRAAKSMARLMTGAPRQCDVGTVLRYAANLPARELFGLADAVSRQLASSPVSTRANMKQQAIALRRYAAVHRLIPLVFPLTFRKDAWERARTMFLDVDGKFVNTASNRASDLLKARDLMFETLQERAEDPFALSLADVDEAKRALRRQGRFSEAVRLHNALHHMGKHFGFGPFAALKDAPPILLSHPEPRRTCGTLTDLLEMIEARKFPEGFRTAFQYHHDASRFTLSQLRAALVNGHKRFPPYRVRREISAESYAGLLVDHRIYLGVAINRLALRPEDCTLETLYGPLMTAVLEAVKAWWAERFAAGEVTATVTNSLAGVVRTAGSMAHTLLHRSLHDRRSGYRAPEGVRASVRRDSEVIVSKTIAEEEWWQAAQDARTMADEIEKAIPDTQNGSTKNTWKDIEKLVEQTPLTSWLRTLDEMKAEVQARRKARENSLAFHWLVLQTFKLAMQISTGMRPEELYHVRLDVQFTADDRKKRRIRLRAIDRKNEVRHTVFVEEGYVDNWLLALYLNVSRPSLMSAREDHPWLFVTRTGRPVGCLGELLDGNGRDKGSYKGRMGVETVHWKDDIGGFFARANGACPDEDNYFTPYVIRNATAAAIYTAMGLHKCCEYLGDSEAVVRDTYGFLSGENSNVGDLAHSHRSSSA